MMNTTLVHLIFFGGGGGWDGEKGGRILTFSAVRMGAYSNKYGRLFPIYVAKFSTGKVSPGIAFTISTKKTTAEAWNWYQRVLWKTGTLISVWNIPSGKIGLPFQMFRCSQKFSAGTTQKVVFHLISKWIFGKLFVTGKQLMAHKVIPRNKPHAYHVTIILSPVQTRHCWPAHNSHMVGWYMLRLLLHVVECCWESLCKVWNRSSHRQPRHYGECQNGNTL